MAANNAGHAIGGLTNPQKFECYGNAAVQAVARVPPFGACFLDFKRLPNKDGLVSFAMASALQSIYTGAPAASASLLRKAVALTYSEYGSTQHQDAGLYLDNLLALLDADQEGVVSLAGGCVGEVGKELGSPTRLVFF